MSLGAAARNPFTLAERLLEVMRDALNENNAAQQAPDRAFVSHGPPVMDVPDQLVVNIGQMRPSASFGGATGGSGLQLPVLHLLDLSVTFTRCHPTGVEVHQGQTKAVSAGTLNRAAELLAIDGWTIYHAAITQWQCYGGPCDLHDVSPLLPIVPEGGVAGWSFTLTADIGRPTTCLSA